LKDIYDRFYDDSQRCIFFRQFTSDDSGDDAASLLSHAKEDARQQQLPFAGSLTPVDAWRLVQLGAATLVDVRTNEERKFVGHVPGSQHVAWATGTALTRNPRFVKEFESKLKDKAAVFLLLCRSGKRSAAAAEALSKAGFVNVFNITEGFEGEINETQQRGQLGGWRLHSLPWVQD
jgi:rhodanese-related sulfurtransferase